MQVALCQKACCRDRDEQTIDRLRDMIGASPFSCLKIVSLDPVAFSRWGTKPINVHSTIPVQNAQ
ncbi:hypothetical protein [Nitrobacter sp. 62-23]|uniref:hypothetical protein n=1 Tax=Nitrobacter sp. 62-23 TaxID=1895798 RepID=UPI0009279C85|nr:hypothetical protein [Nitrobacter sp. 62-23]OJV03113.1 MAG: hypothetical protein BGO16_08045 [Nitrobacter sp. 62-23]